MPTGSMLPVLSETANGIRIVPEAAEDIQIGDIISYQTEQGLIVHRITARGFDNEGYYFIAKGDNNELSDGKIRFEDIKYVTIGVLY